MKGELLPVWGDMRRHLWTPLEKRAGDHPDLYCELFRAINRHLQEPKSLEVLADITDNTEQAKRAFRSLRQQDISGELHLITYLEELYEVLEDLTEAYTTLLAHFLERFSLRYELHHPCLLCPTLSGIFSRHLNSMRAVANTSPHLTMLLTEFDTSIRDLRTDRSEARLKVCIQKHVNLLEGLGQACPNVTGTEIGPIADQVGTWPHNALKASLKSIYGFTSDYPGIRHGGNQAGAVRPLEIKDLVAVAIALTGFATYLTNPYDANLTYLDQ
jgi:hypothetical protein